MDRRTDRRIRVRLSAGLGLLVLAGTVAACGAAFVTPDVTPELSTAYAAQYPDAQPGDLERGRELFTSSCGRGGFCHKLPTPASRSAEKWPGIMERMAEKAALNDAEERDVLRFILVLRGS